MTYISTVSLILWNPTIEERLLKSDISKRGRGREVFEVNMFELSLALSLSLSSYLFIPPSPSLSITCTRLAIVWTRARNVGIIHVCSQACASLEPKYVYSKSYIPLKKDSINL